MRILMFNYEYPPLGGGGGVVHELIAEELVRKHRVTIITSGGLGLPEREMRNGVEVHRVPVLSRNAAATASLGSMLTYPLGAWIKATVLMRRERFDVINCHFAVPTGPGSLLPAKLARVPHVLSLHGGDIYDPSKRLSPHRIAPLRSTVRLMLRHSDAVVAQSSNTRDNAVHYYGYNGGIEIIPLGIRIPPVAEASRAQLGLPERAFLAVTVGRLVRRKAVDRLLNALARPECAPVHLIVVGDGPERESLQNAARDLGVDDRVRFFGRVSEEQKWQILKCSDAYVSATMHEGFGLVYLEAMAAGLPVVTPDHGGQADFLQDGQTGYLVPADDDSALGRAIARLLQEPERTRDLGAANQIACQRYTIERCAQEYEQLFTRVLSERSLRGTSGRTEASLRFAPLIESQSEGPVEKR